MSEDAEVQSVGDDLSVLDVREATSVMEVKRNDGEVMRHSPRDGEEIGRPFTITLYSRDSKAYMDTARRQADRRVALSQRGSAPVPVGTYENDMVELLTVATKSWDIVLDGKLAPNTKEAYKAAYTKYRALFEQVDQHLGQRSNFTKG